jgi:hypothetical protein
MAGIPTNIAEATMAGVATEAATAGGAAFSAASSTTRAWREALADTLARAQIKQSPRLRDRLEPAHSGDPG